MPAYSETILAAQNHPNDSTSTTVTGQQYKGDGYYGRSDGFHTVQLTVTDFVGTIVIQASLATTPTATDWFDVTGTAHTSTNNAHANADGSFFYNFTGNFVWIRAKVVYTAGDIASIKLNH
jgi:uncharacterized protein with FMN-binding domain